jgi:energy-coupling factor transporter ATP-binding protein EcfA2
MEISEFDPSSIRPASITFIIGRRGCGKSTVAEDFMRHLQHIGEGFCMSKTDALNSFWSKHLPKACIHHEYSPDIAKNILERQFLRKERLHKRWISEGITKEPEPKDIPPTFAIYDDVTFDKSFLRDPTTRELFMNGRHYNITILITCQYLMDCGPDLRQQIDYVCMLKDPSQSNRIKLYMYFASVFPTFEKFDKAFKFFTEDREMLIIDNASLSHEINDSVFWYKATPDLDYELGDPYFRRFCEAIYNPNEKKERSKRRRDEMEMSATEKKKRRSIVVRKKFANMSGFEEHSLLLLMNEEVIKHGQELSEALTLVGPEPEIYGARETPPVGGMSGGAMGGMMGGMMGQAGLGQPPFHPSPDQQMMQQQLFQAEPGFREFGVPPEFRRTMGMGAPYMGPQEDVKIVRKGVKNEDRGAPAFASAPQHASGAWKYDEDMEEPMDPMEPTEPVERVERVDKYGFSMDPKRELVHMEKRRARKQGRDMKTTTYHPMDLETAKIEVPSSRDRKKKRVKTLKTHIQEDIAPFEPLRSVSLEESQRKRERRRRRRLLAEAEREEAQRAYNLLRAAKKERRRSEQIRRDLSLM